MKLATTLSIVVALALAACSSKTPAAALSPLETIAPPTAVATIRPTATAFFAVPFSNAAGNPVRSARIILGKDSLLAGHSASKTITSLEVPSGQQRWQTAIGCAPATLANLNGRTYAACEDAGDLVVLEEATGAIIQRRNLGHGAFGVIALPGRLFVTLPHDGIIVALDPASLREISRADAGREPRGLALEGTHLYAVNLFDVAIKSYDATNLGPTGTATIGLQASLAETLTLRLDGSKAYIPHQRMHVTNMNRTFDGTVFPVVSVVDTVTLTPIRREALGLDAVDTPVGMPAASVLSPSGDRLYVVNAASDDLSVVDLTTGIGAGHVVLGHNPRDLAISADGSTLYVLNAVSGDISVVDTKSLRVSTTLALASDPRPAQVRLGEQIFRTSRPETISKDHWIACATCHWDGGIDGQTWLGNDGGPRNTTSLRGLSNTFPLHWSADRPDIQAFQATFTSLMAGSGLSTPELDNMAAYLLSLDALSSPARMTDNSLSESAVNGARVFKQAECTVCHDPSNKFTDQQMHDVGTGQPFYMAASGQGKVPETAGPAFDTPSLRELWMSAPYLHDGRAQTLRDMLTTFNSGGLHGGRIEAAEEVAAMESFLLSLPLTDEERQRLFGK